MSFKRIIIPEQFAKGEKLTKDLIGIGFRLQGRGTKHPNIEDTIVAASIEGIEGDLRTLSLLVDWIDIHYLRINIDRLYRMLKAIPDKHTLAFWSAIATWKSADRRFKRIEGLYKGKRVDLLRTGTDFHINRSGEDPRFESSCLRVPVRAGLRSRPDDILPPHQLAKHHLPYHYRLIIGPTYRADMWAQLELNHNLTPAEIARLSYGSFATAWQVKNEWAVLHEAA